MIPARLGSQRVIKKNLRLINGIPLIAYSIMAAKESGVFSEIYINSEADIFAEIAHDYGIKFYKRPEEHASNKAINDAFAYDFIKSVPGDLLVQLLPTSPLILPVEIRDFVQCAISKNYDSLVSVQNHQIACLYKNEPINFGLTEKHRSSQEMTPVQSYATVLMAWKYQNFIRNMEELGSAYHGGKGKTGYFVVKGLSTIDVDYEDDFELAEVALLYRANKKLDKPAAYYAGKSKNK